MSKFFEKVDDKPKDGTIEITLAKSLEKLVDMLSNTTEFNANELKAISILYSDKYLKALLEFLESNRKHLKRKHSAEILQALQNIASCISANSNNQAILQNGIVK